jgi:predicted secreted protein
MANEALDRTYTISVDGTDIATARTKSFTINNTVVNVSSDEDAGLQRLLDVPGEKSIEVSVEGMTDPTDTTLFDLANSGTDIVGAIVFTSATETITGNFAITSYSDGMPYNDAITFTASFSSDGAIVRAAV